MNYEIEAFIEKHFPIANANAKKEYSFTFDMEEFPNIKIIKIDNIEPFNLCFNPENNTITGKPGVSASTQVDIYFCSETDITKTTYKKTVPFVINADPKDLWQNTPFPQDSIYYKKDEAILMDLSLSESSYYDILDRALMAFAELYRNGEQVEVLE